MLIHQVCTPNLGVVSPSGKDMDGTRTKYARKTKAQLDMDSDIREAKAALSATNNLGLDQFFILAQPSLRKDFAVVSKYFDDEPIE